MTTVDNTNTIIAALEALADAVADGFAAVLAAIGAVQTGVDGMSGHLEHLESDVAGISSDVASVDSSVAAVSSDVASIASDVDDISSSLQDVQSDVAGLSAGIGGSAAALTSVTDAIQRNANAINSLNEKLDMISEAVGAVQTTVETQEDVDPAVRNMLHSAETEQAVAVADFAGTVTKHPTGGVYKASNTFSCTGDVFLDSMAITKVDPVLSMVTALSNVADMVAPKTTVSLNGVNLFESYDNSDTEAATDANVLEITKDRDFDNQFLAAGSTLVVKGSTDQSADGDTTVPTDGELAEATRGSQNYLKYEFNATASDAEGANVYFTLQDYVALKSNKAVLNTTDTSTGTAALRDGTNQATKVQLGTTELYTITVKWFAASSDTTCSISSAVETTSGLPNEDNNVLVALSIDPESTGGLKSFVSKTLDCNGEDTEITGISIQSGPPSDLNSFITVTLSAGGASADVKFDDDNSFDADSSKLPFRFSGSDLTVSGKGTGTLLLQVTYDTVQGNSCS